MSTGAQPRIQFPEALMRERARYRITRTDLARFVGVAEEVVKRWERGDAIPAKDQFRRLIARLPRLTPYPPSTMSLAGDIVTGNLDARAEEVRIDIAKLADSGQLVEPPKPPRQEFGDGLKRVREENEISQAELGELLGLGGNAVGAWESEVNCPVIPNLSKLLEVLPELKAGIETGAIKRPPSLDKDVPNGGRGFPRASTVDAALDMALTQSDEEAKRPRLERPRWSQADDLDRVHDHQFTATPVVTSEPSQLKPERDTTALAIAYARARVAAVRAKAAELAAQEALVNATTDRRNAAKECDDALALLEIAIQEEAS